MALPPSRSIASTTAEAALASFAYVMATFAPFAARRLAIAAPMSREPPVMSAIFPSSFLDIVFFLFLNLALLQIQPRMWAMPFGLAVFGVEDPRLGGRNRNVD